MSSLRFSCLSFLVAVLFIVKSEAGPIVSRTDNGVAVDVGPFFKMNFLRDGGGKLLDIDVLSGLVKVGYDRLSGASPNVDVQVAGLGSSRKRIGNRNKGSENDDPGYEIQ